MRFHSLYLMLILLGVTILAGCNSASSKVTKTGQTAQTSTPQTTYADGAPRITITELQAKIKKNEVYIVDVRNEASYNAGHIPGAKLIPSTDILNHLDELPKNKLIVTYCS